jgi:S1-C subfamily serine protease
VAPTGPAAGKLMVGDVMTAVDGLPIDDDGTIALPGGRRMPCSYHFMHRFDGDTLRISVARDGKPMELGVPATAGRAADLAPDGPPPFYLHAGLVFMPLTRNLAQSLCSGELNDSKIHLFSRSILQKDDDPAVVVGRVLPDEITEKCEPVVGECVKAIDGREVKDLGALRRAIESGKDPFLVIEFQSGAVLVFDRAKARAATGRILRRLDIPADHS